MTRIRLPLLPAWTRWSGVLAVAAAIFYFSVITVPPQVTPEPDPLLDKKLHFASYGVLTLALAYATARTKRDPRTRILIVVVGAIAYGVGIEVVQAFIPYRAYSPADMVANTLGVALGSLWFLVETRLEYSPLSAIRH